jgi:hypothetical protein
MQTYDALENFIMNKNKEAKESKKSKKSPIQNVTNVSDIMNKTPAKKPAPKGVPKTPAKQPIKSVDTPKQPLPQKFPTQQEPRSMPVKRPPNGLEDLPDLPEDPELFEEDDDDGGFERGDPDDSGEDVGYSDEQEEDLMEEPLEGITSDEDDLEPYEKDSEEPVVPLRASRKQPEQEPEEPQHAQRVITREIPRPLLQKKPNAQSTPIKREKPRLQQQQSRQPVPEKGNGMSAYQIQMAERERRLSPETQSDIVGNSELENENELLKQQLQSTNKKLDELVKYVSNQRKLSTPLEEQYRDEQEAYDTEFDEIIPEKSVKQPKKVRPEKKSLLGRLFKKKEKPARQIRPEPVQKKPVPRPQPVTIPQKRYSPAPEPKTRSTFKRIILALVGIMIAGLGIWLTTAPKMIADIPNTLAMGIVLIALGVNLFLNEL